MLAHRGQHLWPEVVTAALWPFTYKTACHTQNCFKLDEKGVIPDEKLAGVIMKQEVKHEHPLFCPVFALHSSLQSCVAEIPEWDLRSQAGVYLGHSPETRQ